MNISPAAIIPNPLLVVNPPAADLLRLFQPRRRFLAVVGRHEREQSRHGPGLEGLCFAGVFAEVSEPEGEFGLQRQDETVGCGGAGDRHYRTAAVDERHVPHRHAVRPLVFERPDQGLALIFGEDRRRDGAVFLLERFALDEEVQDRRDDGQRCSIRVDVDPRKLRMSEHKRHPEIANMSVFKRAGDLGILSKRLATAYISTSQTSINKNLLVADKCYQGGIAQSRLVQKSQNLAQPIINVADGIQIIVHRAVFAPLSSVLDVREVVRSMPGMVG